MTIAPEQLHLQQLRLREIEDETLVMGKPSSEQSLAATSSLVTFFLGDKQLAPKQPLKPGTILTCRFTHPVMTPEDMNFAVQFAYTQPSVAPFTLIDQLGRFDSAHHDEQIEVPTMASTLIITVGYHTYTFPIAKAEPLAERTTKVSPTIDDTEYDDAQIKPVEISFLPATDTTPGHLRLGLSDVQKNHVYHVEIVRYKGKKRLPPLHHHRLTATETQVDIEVTPEELTGCEPGTILVIEAYEPKLQTTFPQPNVLSHRQHLVYTPELLSPTASILPPAAIEETTTTAAATTTQTDLEAAVIIPQFQAELVTTDPESVVISITQLALSEIQAHKRYVMKLIPTPDNASQTPVTLITILGHQLLGHPARIELWKKTPLHPTRPIGRFQLQLKAENGGMIMPLLAESHITIPSLQPDELSTAPTAPEKVTPTEPETAVDVTFSLTKKDDVYSAEVKATGLFPNKTYLVAIRPSTPISSRPLQPYKQLFCATDDHGCIDTITPLTKLIQTEGKGSDLKKVPLSIPVRENHTHLHAQIYRIEHEQDKHTLLGSRVIGMPTKHLKK